MATLSATTICTIILDGMAGASFGLRRDLSRIIALEMSEKDITSLRKALEKIEKLQHKERIKPVPKPTPKPKRKRTVKGGSRA